MPQAPESLRLRIAERFGDFDCIPVVEWLKNRGWELTEDFSWLRPPGRTEWTDDEDEAISFLLMEWDYGGIVVDE